MQEALRDAENGSKGYSVAYKDDRIGRRLWDAGNYVMELKKYGVDIYTVKTAIFLPNPMTLRPDNAFAIWYGNAQEEQFRYGNASQRYSQKAGSTWKIYGGKAPLRIPFGIIREISKHGRASEAFSSR